MASPPKWLNRRCHARWGILAAAAIQLSSTAGHTQQDVAPEQALAERLVRFETAVGTNAKDLVSQVCLCPGAALRSDVRKLAKGFRAACDAVKLVEREILLSRIDGESVEAYESLSASARAALMALQASAFVRLAEDGGQEDGLIAAARFGSALRASAAEDWRSMPVSTTAALVAIRIAQRLIDGGNLNAEAAGRLRKALSPLESSDPTGTISQQWSRFAFALDIGERLAYEQEPGTRNSLRRALWPDELAIVDELNDPRVVECCKSLVAETRDQLRGRGQEFDMLAASKNVVRAARERAGCGGWGSLLVSKLESGAAISTRVKEQSRKILDSLSALADPERASRARESFANAVYRYRLASELILQATSERPETTTAARRAALDAAKTEHFDPSGARCEGCCARFIEQDLIDRCRVAVWLADAADAAEASAKPQEAETLREAVQAVARHCLSDRSLAADLVASCLAGRAKSRKQAGGDADASQLHLTKEARGSMTDCCHRWYPTGNTTGGSEGKADARSWLRTLSDPQFVLAAMAADAALARGNGGQPSWRAAEAAQVDALLSLTEISPHAERLGALIAASDDLDAVEQALAAVPVDEWWQAFQRAAKSGRTGAGTTEATK